MGDVAEALSDGNEDESDAPVGICCIDTEASIKIYQHWVIQRYYS